MTAKNSIACYLDSVVQRHLVQMMASVLENQTRSIMYKNTYFIVGMKASAASLEMMAAENSTLVHLCQLGSGMLPPDGYVRAAICSKSCSCSQSMWWSPNWPEDKSNFHVQVTGAAEK